jgi:hypothetical protein
LDANTFLLFNYFSYTIIDSNLTTLNEVLPALANYRKKGVGLYMHVILKCFLSLIAAMFSFSKTCPINYSQDCDMILGAISQSIGIGRLDYLEIPHSWLHARIAFLIPMPDVLLNNVDAVIKPFQKWVYVSDTHNPA